MAHLRSVHVKRALIAAVVGLLAVFGAWLIVGDSTPLTLHGELGITAFNFIADVGIPAALVSILLTRNVHDYYGPIFFVAFFLEAFLVAYLVLFCIIRNRTSHKG